MRAETPRRLVLVSLALAAVLPFIVSADAPAAAPPAQASIAMRKAPVAPRSLTYELIAPGVLARTLFATDEAGPVVVQIVDLLVGPDQNAELPAQTFAALFEIEAGGAQVSLDGKVVTASAGGVIAVSEGQRLGIDTRQEARPLVARLIKFSATEEQERDSAGRDARRE
jgi:hypothetical protein